jgi:sugar lactone lactonase YvrE
VSRPVDNAIIAVDPATGAQRPVVQGILAAPGGLAVSGADLLVADAYGTRTVDLATRGVTTVPFDLAVHAGAMVAASAQTIVLSNVRRGTLVIVDRKTGRARHSLGGFKAPMGVMIERDDTLLLVDYGTGELLRVTPGASPERAAVFGGLQGPVGLAAGPVGRVYVTEAGAGRIIAIDLAGGNRTIIAENLAQPEGIAVMPDGRLAVAEVGARRLLTVAPVTGDIGIVAEDLPMGAVFTRAPAPVYLPTGVAADSAGALYVVCDRDNTVLKFSP